MTGGGANIWTQAQLQRVTRALIGAVQSAGLPVAGVEVGADSTGIRVRVLTSIAADDDDGATTMRKVEAELNAPTPEQVAAVRERVLKARERSEARRARKQASAGKTD